MDSALKIITGLLLVGNTLLARADFPDEFIKKFPGARDAKIVRAFPGFWSVTMSHDVFFVRDDMSILISGNVIDLKTKRSLTAELSKLDRPRVNVSDLKLADAITFGRGTRRLFVFSDPDCPYCRRLDGDLAKLNNVTIYLFLFPLTRLHPDASGVSESIWCQADRSKAWKTYQKMATQYDPTSLASEWRKYLHYHSKSDQTHCPNPISRNRTAGEKWSINGTPAMIFDDGTLIIGRMSMQQIETQLNESENIKTSGKRQAF